MKRIRKYLPVGCLVGIVVCVLLAGISALSNRGLPQPPADLSRLDPLDKARLAETLRLKAELGDELWPGFAQAQIPVIIWNREYSFLVGPASAPPGWELMADDDFYGQPLYRQVSNDPQNFAVKVGDEWAGCLATKAEMDAFTVEMIDGFLPPVIDDIFPYRLVIQPSEVQMGGTLHEIFHAFQTNQAADKLFASERAHRLGDAYAVPDEGMHAAWKAEINLLVKAVEAGSDAEAAALVAQFLAARQARRQAAGLSSDLIGYERQIEWEEGLAKYIELKVWELAAASDSAPVAELAGDVFFKEYQTFDQRWSQVLTEARLPANQDSEIRFYNTGQLQANLLDRLLPGWKEQAFAPDVWLEDLLATAVETHP